MEKNLGNRVLEVLKLRNKMRSDRFVFESAIKSIQELRELGYSTSVNTADSFYERHVVSYADYIKAHLTLPKEMQELIGREELPPYYRTKNF